MKRTNTVLKKRLALALSIIILVGLLPLKTMAAGVPSDIEIFGVKDGTGVTATLDNNTSASVSVILVFAVYEPNGRLSYNKDYPVAVGASSSATQRFDYDVAAHPDYIYKLFAWDNPSFAPLCKDITSKRCITVDGSDAVYDGIGLNVTANPAVTDFMFVMVDEMTKRGGVAYNAEKAGGKWTHTKAEGVDVIIAYRPADYIGAALPDIEMTNLRLPDGNNRTRVVISL